MTSALGRKAIIEELRKGAIINVFPNCRGGRYYRIPQDKAPSLTVKQDSAQALERDGLIKSTAKSIWQMSFELVPTKAFWEKYPKVE